MNSSRWMTHCSRLQLFDISRRDARSQRAKPSTSVVPERWSWLLNRTQALPNTRGQSLAAFLPTAASLGPRGVWEGKGNPMDTRVWLWAHQVLILDAFEVTTDMWPSPCTCDCKHPQRESIVSSLSLLTGREKIFHFIHHLQLAAVILKNQWVLSS